MRLPYIEEIQVAVLDYRATEGDKGTTLVDI